MPNTCASCKGVFHYGRVKDGEAFYCSDECRFNGFFAKFKTALASAAASNPNPFSNAPACVEAEPLEAAQAPSSSVAGAGKDLIVVLLGTGVCLAVALLIYSLVNLFGYPFHGQTVWFIIPIGAAFCGMAAGSGFWLALRYLDRLPRLGTYLAAVVAGALSYLLIYFLMWWLAEFQGVRIREQIAFGDFLQYVLEHQRIRVGQADREGFEAGKFGYVRFMINIVGFTLGVVGVVAVAGEKAHCPTCQRYLKTVGKQVRSSSDPEAAATGLRPVIFGIRSGRIQEAVDLHAAWGVSGSKEYFATTIGIETCAGCGMCLATLSASVRSTKSAQEFLKGFVYQGTTHQPVQL